MQINMYKLIDMDAKDIRVPTPGGLKHHGHLVTQPDGTKYFHRRVEDKDRMRIYDAWSIHPQIIEEYGDQIIGIMWETKNFLYKVKTENIQEAGFEKEHSGGKTMYFPIDKLIVIDKENRQPELL